MAEQFFEHQIAYITARIEIKLLDIKSIGTGFFYRAFLSAEKDRSIILLISNKHVFLNPKGRLIISLNRKKEDGTPEFGSVETFDQVGFENAYFTHPDPEVDLACINVSDITRTNAFYKFLDGNLLKPID